MAEVPPIPYPHRDGTYFCNCCDYHVTDPDYFIQHMLQRHSVTVALHDLTAPAVQDPPQGEAESDVRPEEGA